MCADALMVQQVRTYRSVLVPKGLNQSTLQSPHTGTYSYWYYCQAVHPLDYSDCTVYELGAYDLRFTLREVR